MTGIDALLREPAIQATGWALLHFVWQGTLVGLLAAVAFRALRHSAADVRYVVGAIALSLMATMPLVTGVQAWRAASADAVPRSAVMLVPVDDASGPVDVRIQRTGGGDAASAQPDWTRSGRLGPWLPVLVLVWMAGVGILALRLAIGWMWIQRMRTRAAVPAATPLQAVAQRLTRSLHIKRTVRLLQSAAVDVPTVIGWLKPTILLPAGVLAGLSPLQVEAILAHELAHVRRHDYFVNLLQTVVETLLFYHPAVWWLSRRIRVEREHCCDDLAVSLCGDPIVYARALADLEELRGLGARLVMAASGGALFERVRRLVAAPPTHAGRGPAWLAAATAIGLMLVIAAGAVDPRPMAAAEAITLPMGPLDAVPETAARQEPTQRETTGTVTWSDNGERLSIKFRGTFTLNDTDTDVSSLSPGGYLHITDGGWLSGWFKGGQARLLELTADGAGNITRRFRVGGNDRPFEPEGRLWLKEVLPRFVRQSGFAAKERVARFLAKGGVPAVLAEISEIQGSYAKKVYFTQLLKQSTLEGASARRMLEQAGREIDSNYELASTLIAAARLLSDEEARRAYLDAARKIESNYEMRRVFTAVLDRGTVAPALIAGILDAARSLDSSYEAASLLVDIVKQHAIEGVVRAPFFSALDTIDSSYEKGRVLQNLLRRGDLSPETLLAAMTAAATIDSNHETAQVLIAATRSHTISGAAREAYIRAADRLDDHDRNRSLAALERNRR